MTEAEARVALRAFVGVGDLERWIAEQRWEPIPDGWRVRERLNSWRFRVEPAPGGIWGIMSVTGGEPATWFVPAQPGPTA